MKYPVHPKTIDLVICGPDFSGTSTQVGFALDFYRKKSLKVRSICGTEYDALFHAEAFTTLNQDYTSLSEFLSDPAKCKEEKSSFLLDAYKLLSGSATGKNLFVASMVRNDVSSYINPDTADVWILEEPSCRSAGQANRVIEQNRKAFKSVNDPASASLSHQAYRTDEFLRFRRSLREAGKRIIRSRSEESACYQIYDAKSLNTGIGMEEYLALPGHLLAFANPPTHIIIACGKNNWTRDEYMQFKKTRLNGRQEDEYEKDLEIQMLVNERYATGWIENLYSIACSRLGSIPPQVARIDMTLDKENTRAEIERIMDQLEGVA